MNQEKLRKRLLSFRIITWTLFSLTLLITLIGFTTLKLMENGLCYTFLGFGGGATTFTLLFAFITVCLSLKNYNIHEVNVTVYATFKTRIILLNDKPALERHRFFFWKTVEYAFNIGKKKIQVFVSMSNEVAVKVDGEFIPCIKKEKTS